jgi:glycosyltransferase involved in cell wall biosynthesis
MLSFSIIIPIYRKPDNLFGLLTSLAALRYPASRFEVIVVDDGSPVELLPTIQTFRGRLNLTLLKQNNSGPAFARNQGAGIAKGDYLAFTDDDCQPQPEWLNALDDALGKSDRRVCGGKTINGLSGNICTEASQLLSDYLSMNYSPTTTLGAFFPANNLAVSKEGFWKAGGFDASLRFGEDRDFCYRCRALGFSFAYASDAVVVHSHHQTLLTFFHLHSCYGGGTYAFRRGCTAKALPKVPISSPSWYLKLALSGIRKTKSLRGVALSLLLIASQCAVLVGMLREALKRLWSDTGLLIKRKRHGETKG